MKEQPLVSVVMSVHNGEKDIASTVVSILSQTLKRLELVVVDDDSKDGTYKVLRELSRQDSRIRLIKNDRNLGLTQSLNRAIKVTKGEYIARIDCGDIAVEDRLQRQVDYLKANSSVYLVGSNVTFFNDSCKFDSWTICGVANNRKNIIRHNYMFHPTIMFRNENRVKYRDKFRYSQDYDLYLNMRSAGLDIDNIPHSLVMMSISKGSISANNQAGQRYFGGKAMEFYCQRVKYGKDEYDSMDVEGYKQSSGQSGGYDARKYLIDLVVYSSKVQTVKTLLKYWSVLDSSYKFRKIFLLMLPKSVLVWFKLFRGKLKFNKMMVNV